MENETPHHFLLRCTALQRVREAHRDELPAVVLDEDADDTMRIQHLLLVNLAGDLTTRAEAAGRFIADLWEARAALVPRTFNTTRFIP